jgi:hypothetical protein
MGSPAPCIGRALRRAETKSVGLRVLRQDSPNIGAFSIAGGGGGPEG